MGPESKNISYYQALAGNYDLFFAEPEICMEQEGAWLAAVLAEHGARDVLDASCGTGRQSIPLRKRGYGVTGADPSPAMLAEARRAAAAHEVDFRLVQCGFSELSGHFGSDFDAVIALGNGLCNLERPDDIRAALVGMRACCRPGGLCLVGIKDFDRVRAQARRFHGHRVVDREGTRSILFEVWDFDDPVLVCTAYLLRGERDEDAYTVSTAQTREYMLGEDELSHLASGAGFRSVRRLDHPWEAVFELRP